MTWSSPETFVALVTALGGFITAIRLWVKQQAQARQIAEQQNELDRRGTAEDNLAILGAAIEAYKQNSDQLQEQVKQAREEGAADRDRHSRELEAIRVHLEGCERDRSEQGRQIARLQLEVEGLKGRE